MNLTPYIREWFDISSKKNGVKFSLLLIVAITLGSFIYSNSALAQAGNNGGNSTMTMDTDPTQRALSYTLYKVGESCVRYTMRNTIRTEPGDNGATTPKIYGSGGSDGTEQGEWFADTDAYGFVFSEGKQNCTEILKAGLSLWGFADGASLLRAMGFTFQSNVPQWVSSVTDGNARAEKFKQAVRGRAGNVESLTDNAAKHLLYLDAFKRTAHGCEAKNVVSYDEADQTQKGWGDNNTRKGELTYTTITLAEGGGTKKYIFTYKSGSEEKGAVWRWQGDGSSYPGQNDKEEYGCSELAKMITSTAPGLASWNENHTGQEVDPEAPAVVPSGSGDGESPANSCAIDGIGWILCPLVNALAGFADGAFTVISNNLLRTDTNTVSTDGVAYQAWVVMRNIANVAFVIAFLIIIFSQLTGVGITNYGVKKMLPRLVIAAILVNVSFFICQIAVDLSNILGYSINDALRGVTNRITDASASDNASFFATGTSFSAIAVGVLGAGVAVVLIYALLSVFIPVILAAVIALITILFLLIARQALIVILIVLAPLAFVAFLLPNTEKLFTQWRKILTSLLLLFPIISLVFGLSTLASTVVTYSFNNDLTNESLKDASGNSFFGQIIGAAILVLPLFVIPTLLKKSLDAVPMIGQLASKWAGRANTQVGSKLKESYKGSLVGRGVATRKQAKESYRARRFAERISKGGKVGALNQFMATGVPILPADRYAAKTLKRDASDAAEEYLVKDTQRASKSMQGKVDREGLRKLAAGGVHEIKDDSGRVIGKFDGSDIATRAAAMEQVVASNDVRGMAELWDQSRSWGGEEGRQLRTSFARSLQSSSSRPAYYGAGAIAGLQLGTHGSHDDTLTEAVKAGAYSPEKIASADKDELNEVVRVSEAKAISDPSYASSHAILQADAEKALSDDVLGPKMSKNRDNAAYLAGRPGASPPPPLT